MPPDFAHAKYLIEDADHIVLTTHERTDGDDFGTVAALADIIRDLGKKVQIIIKGGIPKNLQFISESFAVTETPIETNKHADLIIISGCSNKQRVGIEELFDHTAQILNIDHHPDNTFFGHANIVDPKASSVAELAYHFITWSGWHLTSDAATALLAGIMADTGSFMHSNTQSSTMRASADLLKKGATPNQITKNTLRGKSIPTLHAWGKAIENTKLNTRQSCVYTVLTEDDFKSLDNIPHSAFEGLVETLNKSREAKFSMLLKQDGNQIKGSLRSEAHKAINVASIAKLLGGGGHKLASGFTIQGKLIHTGNTWKIIDN